LVERLIGARGGAQRKKATGHMTESKNAELTTHPIAEHFHTAARLRELAAEATTPWVKQYLRSLIADCEPVTRNTKNQGPP